MGDTHQKILDLEEFERLTLPLTRLKVSLVYQHALREREVAESIRLAAAQHGLPVPKVTQAILADPEAGSRIVFRTLSFELGLLEEKYPHSDQLRGEASIRFGLCWRVESPRAVVFGNQEDGVEIERELESFKGRRVLDIGTVGRLPEVAVRLSGRRWIQSFATGWNIGLPDRTSIFCRAGRLVHGSPQ